MQALLEMCEGTILRDERSLLIDKIFNQFRKLSREKNFSIKYVHDLTGIGREKLTGLLKKKTEVFPWTDRQLQDLYAVLCNPSLQGPNPVGAPKKPEVKNVDLLPRAPGRRHELQMFHLGSGPESARLLAWEGLAAGWGEDLEPTTEVEVLRPPDRAGIHIAKIRGDSMEPTLASGDLVLVQNFNPGIVLPAISDDEPTTSLPRFRGRVPHDKIYIVSVNNSSPTCKRIRYAASQSRPTWHMLLYPDNQLLVPQIIDKSDEVRVLGQVIGLVEGAA